MGVGGWPGPMLLFRARGEPDVLKTCSRSLHKRVKNTFAAVWETKTALQFFSQNGPRATQKLHITPANGVVEVKTAVQEMQM